MDRGASRAAGATHDTAKSAAASAAALTVWVWRIAYAVPTSASTCSARTATFTVHLDGVPGPTVGRLAGAGGVPHRREGEGSAPPGSGRRRRCLPCYRRAPRWLPRRMGRIGGGSRQGDSRHGVTGTTVGIERCSTRPRSIATTGRASRYALATLSIPSPASKRARPVGPPPVLPQQRAADPNRNARYRLNSSSNPRPSHVA